MIDPIDKTIAASPNPAEERRRQLEALIPEAFSEGKLDVAALRRALGAAVEYRPGPYFLEIRPAAGIP